MPRPRRRGGRARSAASASSRPTTGTPSRCSRRTARARTRRTRRIRCRSSSRPTGATAPRRRHARRPRPDLPGPARSPSAGGNERNIPNRHANGSRRYPLLYCGSPPRRPSLSLPQPDLALLRKAQKGDERAFAVIVRAVRAAGLQLRPAHGGRPRARRGPHAGHLPPRLPGAAALLAPVSLHDVALPDREEPDARRAPRPRAASRSPSVLDRGRAADRRRGRAARAGRDDRRALARGRGAEPGPEDGAAPARRRRPRRTRRSPTRSRSRSPP